MPKVALFLVKTVCSLDPTTFYFAELYTYMLTLLVHAKVGGVISMMHLMGSISTQRLVCFAKQDPGRAAKQEQEENSRNHIKAF